MSCLSSRIPDSRMMSGTKCSVALPMLHSKPVVGLVRLQVMCLAEACDANRAPGIAVALAAH